MTPAETYQKLISAGISLKIEGTELVGKWDTRPDPALIELARVHKEALILVTSDAWLSILRGWSADKQFLWAEQAAYREYGCATPRAVAERAAFLDLHIGLERVPYQLLSPLTAIGAELVAVRHKAEHAENEGEEPEAARFMMPGAHWLCCGGCGCKSLTQGGLGPCHRCGWQKPDNERVRR